MSLPHCNLPALEAVLADLQSIDPDLIVVGGDVVAGPMPAEVLDRLAALGQSICFVRGNADREVLAAYGDGRYTDATDAADPAERTAAFAASKIDRAQRDLLASLAERIVVEVEGVGQVLFCHGSPRSDEEIVTAATTEGLLREILEGGRSRPCSVRTHPCPVRSVCRRQEGHQRWQRGDALSG